MQVQTLNYCPLPCLHKTAAMATVAMTTYIFTIVEMTKHGRQ